ncbi:MAG: ParB/RepB/Spo0J family partition protein [Mycobacteriales bacterium]
MNRRGGLGKGLGALIPTREDGAASEPSQEPVKPQENIDTSSAGAQSEELQPVPGASFRELLIAEIVPNPQQPRAVFEEEALEELKASIDMVGVLQPVVVRRTGPNSYELIMGERRFRACQALGREKIPAIIRETSDDALLRDALLENIHRVDLNPLEEAAAYQQLLAEFDVTHDELAKRIGRSRPQISNTVRLLNLQSAVQRRVAARVLSAGHARALLAMENIDVQEELAHRIVAEGLSVRATEEIVAMRRSDAPTQQESVVKRRKPQAPGLDYLANRLADQLETRVKVDMGRRKGKIVIEFATVDDLNRIVASIDNGPK